MTPIELPEVQIGTSKKPTSVMRGRWWDAKKGEVANEVVPLVTDIRAATRFRELEFLRFRRLYQNAHLMGFGAANYNQTITQQFAYAGLTWNVLKSVIDTAVSKLGKNRPKPQFVTTKGNYTLQKRAEQMTDYLAGVFQSTHVYDYGIEAFTDACIFGTGILKIFLRNGELVVERVLPHEIVVADADAIYKTPRQMHQVKYMSRDVLKEMFPKFATQIDTTRPEDMQYMSGRSADLIPVTESWHLRSGPNATDGRHAICIQGCTLYDERYEKDYFPFVVIRWTEPTMGWWGQGIGHELLGIQLELNKLLLRIQESIERIAVPRVFIQHGSKVVSDHLNDTVAGIVKYSGQPPVFQTAQAVGPELFNYVELLYRRAYEITGVTNLSATGQKPAGITAGVALRTLQDVETERFMAVSQRYEKMYLLIAEIMIDLTRDLAAQRPDLAATVSKGKHIRSLKWADVELPKENYQIEMYATSWLPSTPAGRLQTVQELMQSGFLPKEMALQLLNMPDIQGFYDISTAAYDDVLNILSKIMDDGEYTSPDRYMNLDLAVKVSQSMYLRGKTDGVPEDRLDMIDRFIRQCEELMAPPPEPSLPPAEAQDMMPGVARPELAPRDAPLAPQQIDQGAAIPQPPMM